MARIFITGVAGFLGSHLAERLVADDHEVYGNDNLVGGDIENVPKKVHFADLDCLSPDLEQFFPNRIDCVYHCACHPHEGLSVFSPVKIAAESVYLATMKMANIAVNKGVRRFVFLSSMARYGKHHSFPFSECITPNPVDPYGYAKLAAERTLMCLGDVHNMQIVVAVPHNIIGTRQRWSDPFRNVASIFINLMLQNRRIYIYGNGTQRRCFSFVDDCVEPLYQMGYEQNVIGETINIGPDDNPISINALGMKLSEMIGVPFDPIYVKHRPCEVKDAWPSADKARRLLGYDPKTKLEEGLAKMIAYIREKGVKKFEYHLPIEIVNSKLPETWQKRLF